MDNRTRILAVALKLFAARGYDAVGIQEIVDAAGITKPTLYHYFGNKQGLLEALVTVHFEELLQSLRPAALYQGDLPLTLNRVAAAYFQYAEAHRLFYRMQLGMWFAPADSLAFKVVAQFSHQQQTLLEDVFQRAVKEHGNMRGRQRTYAATFLGTLNTYIGLGLNGYVDMTEALAYRVVHQFMHGIFS